MSTPVDGLRAQGLVKRFGPRAIIDGVEIHVAAGQVLALVGGNGSGKTTLLRILAGLLEPDDGEVTWQGRPLDESDPWVRSELAILLDDAGAFPDLSVGEHLELLARAFAVPDPAAAAAAVLDEVGLAAQRDQLPATLSSGQRHRLSLGSVLVRPAALMVLDEPEQRLDAEGRLWLADRLRAAADDGAAIVIASHDQAVIDTTADLVLELA
ncbi:MAG: heme ABC exporter ATP-binding protein CcmA [Rhodoferax sp.]|nr:heme ABC exporter ATP-binding protein CcmA [Actinomycetota bacterium]